MIIKALYETEIGFIFITIIGCLIIIGLELLLAPRGRKIDNRKGKDNAR